MSPSTAAAQGSKCHTRAAIPSSIVIHRKISRAENDTPDAATNKATIRWRTMDGLSWTIFGISFAAAAIAVWEVWSRNEKRDAVWKAAWVSTVFNLIVAALAFISGFRTAQANAESALAIAAATAAGEGAKKDAALAQVGLSKAILEIEERRQENLKLEMKLEQERQARLVLQQAIAPRGIEQDKSAQFLRAFAGTRVTLVSLSDPEPRMTAEQIKVLLEAAGWVVVEGQPRERVEFDGIVVYGVIDTGDAETAGQLGAIGKALASQLVRNSKVAAMYKRESAKPPQAESELQIVVGDIPEQKALIRKLQDNMRQRR